MHRMAESTASTLRHEMMQMAEQTTQTELMTAVERKPHRSFPVEHALEWVKDDLKSW